MIIKVINNNTITIETAEPIPIFDTANPCWYTLIGNVKVPEAPPVFQACG